MTYTLGKTDVGGFGNEDINDVIIGSFHLCPFKTAIVKSVLAYIIRSTTTDDTNFSYKAAIYNYAGDGDPSTLMTGSTATNENIKAGKVVANWVTFTMSSLVAPLKSLRPNTKYYLCVWGDKDQRSANITVPYDIPGAAIDQGFTKALAIAPWPSEIIGETGQNRIYSIYATVWQDTRPGFQYNVKTP